MTLSVSFIKAQTHQPQKLIKKKIYQQNYYSSVKLVDYCQSNKIKLIYASSAATYGIKEKI